MSVFDDVSMGKDADAVASAKLEDDDRPVPPARKKRLLAATGCVLGELECSVRPEVATAKKPGEPIRMHTITHARCRGRPRGFSRH